MAWHCSLMPSVHMAFGPVIVRTASFSRSGRWIWQVAFCVHGSLLSHRKPPHLALHPGFPGSPLCQSQGLVVMSRFNRGSWCTHLHAIYPKPGMNGNVTHIYCNHEQVFQPALIPWAGPLRRIVHASGALPLLNLSSGTCCPAVCSPVHNHRVLTNRQEKVWRAWMLQLPNPLAFLHKQCQLVDIACQPAYSSSCTSLTPCCSPAHNLCPPKNPSP